MMTEISGVTPYKPSHTQRLTERNPEGQPFVPGCFEEPCLGNGCVRKGACVLFVQVCAKLAEYEDTGLSPHEVQSLLERVREHG